MYYSQLLLCLVIKLSSLSFFFPRCVIAELFNEGNRLFDLSELLSYRNGDYDPTATLSKIEDANIRVSHVVGTMYMYFLHYFPFSHFTVELHFVVQCNTPAYFKRSFYFPCRILYKLC